MLETALMVLFGIGAAAYLLGRWLMIHDANGVDGVIWTLALRVIPLAELMFLVRYYDQAKRGAFTCIAGLWLMVPFFGHRLWQVENAFDRVKQQWAQREASGDDAESGPAINPQLLALLPAEALSAMNSQHQLRYVAKEQKVRLLEQRLAWWYGQIQQRRAALPAGDSRAVLAFNEEANAYAALNQLAGVERAELAKLRPR
jgi:hypothetical protein